MPFPNFWNGDLNVKISDLELGLCLQEVEGKGKEKETTPYQAEEEEEAVIDLESSLINAADKALKKDKEGQELENSIINETSTSTSELPIGEQEEEKITIISSIVESLLQRLKIQIHNLKIRIVNQSQHQHQQSSSAFEFLIKEINFDTNSSAIAPSSFEETLDSQTFSIQETFRNIRLSGISLWISDSSRAASSSSRRRKSQDSNRRESSLNRSSGSSSDSSSGSSSEREGNGNYMEMSSAIQDLRESRVGFDDLSQSVDSEAMYHSAVDLNQGDEEEESSGYSKQDSIEINSSRKEDQKPKEDQEMVMFLSLAEDEPLTVRLKTTKYIFLNSSQEQSFEDPTTTSISEDPFSKDSQTKPSSLNPSKPKEMNLSISVPNVSVFLDAYQISTILSWVRFFASNLQHPSTSTPTPTRRTPSRSKKSTLKPFEVSFKVASIQIVLPYDVLVSSQQMAAERSSFFKSSEGYRPIVSHLRVRIQEIQTQYLTDGHSRSSTISVKDLAVFECLDPKLLQPLRHRRRKGDEELPRKNQTIQDTLPLIVFDDTLEPQPSEEADSFESLDWRKDDSNKSSSIYQSTDFSDNGWKLKSKDSNKSRLTDGRESLNRVSEMNAISVQVDFKDFDEMIDGDGQQQIKSIGIKLKPLHVFIDPSIIKRTLPSLTRITSSFNQSIEREEDLDRIVDVDLGSSISTILGNEDIRRASNTKQHQGEREAQLASDDRSSSDIDVRLDCALVRLEVRVPSKPSKSNSLDDSSAALHNYSGLDTRSGIVTVDLVSLEFTRGNASTPESKTSSQGVRFNHEETNPLEVEILSIKVQEVIIRLKPANQDGSKRIASIGRMSSLIGEERSEKIEEPRNEMQPLLPKFSIKRKASKNSLSQTSSIYAPSIQVNLSKNILDSLFFLVDDLSTFPASIDQDFQGWLEDEDGNLVELVSETSSLQKQEVEKIKNLGSQILGTALKNSVLSYDSDETEKNGNGSDFGGSELKVEELQLILELGDRFDQDKPSDEDKIVSRSLNLNGKEPNVNLTSRKKDLLSKPSERDMDSTLINLSLSSLMIQEGYSYKNGAKTNREILNRTFKPSLTNRNIAPMISVSFTSLNDTEIGYRESQVEFELRSFTLFLTEDLGLVTDLKKFLKSPEGVSRSWL